MIKSVLLAPPETGLFFLSTRFRRMKCRGRWRTVHMMHKNVFRKPCPKEGIGTFCHALFMASCDRFVCCEGLQGPQNDFKAMSKAMRAVGRIPCPLGAGAHAPRPHSFE